MEELFDIFPPATCPSHSTVQTFVANLRNLYANLRREDLYSARSALEIAKLRTAVWSTCKTCEMLSEAHVCLLLCVYNERYKSREA